MNIDAKALLNQKNYILKSKRMMAVEFDEIKENIRLKIENDIEDYTKGDDGDKIDGNVIEHQKRDQGNNNTGFGKVENNKHPRAEEEQYTIGSKLKEDIQIIWHKVRLLEMSGREKLPKLKTNSKMIKFQEKIKAVIE